MLSEHFCLLLQYFVVFLISCILRNIVVFFLIFRVPIYKGNCDPKTELTLSIAERAQTVQTSFESVWNFGDAQKQGAEEPFSRTGCRNCLQTDEPSLSRGNLQNSLENENIRCASGDALIEEGETDSKSVAVCVSLVVNGNARAKTASSSSALHSKKALSDDTLITVNAVQADQLNSVESSAVAMKDDSGGMARGVDVGWAKCSSSGQLVNCSCLNDSEVLCDKETCQSEVHNGSDCLESKQYVVSQVGYKNGGMSDNEESVPAVHETSVMNEVSETVVDGLMSRVAAGKDALLANGNVGSDHREVLAVEVHQSILDSDDRVADSADSRLLKTGQKLDDLSRGIQDLDVRAQDVVDESAGLHEVSGLASSSVRSSADNLATSSKDAVCHSCEDSIPPVEARDFIPDRHSMKEQLSDIANSIENLQSWIQNANSDVQSNAVGVAADVSLSVVEQYAGELQKRKIELDQLNSQVKELEKFDKNVVYDERRRLVSVHAQLHGLSASLNTIASEAVRI